MYPTDRDAVQPADMIGLCAARTPAVTTSRREVGRCAHWWGRSPSQQRQQRFLAAVAPASVADTPVGPGTVSHFDLARKDCLGTARNTTSKIWYTVADGVLSDVYAPTIDTTNV
jgi:Glucodextranase, domain N